jgi:pyruvate kinase
MSSNIAIFAMSDNLQTLRKVTLYRGVYPCGIEKTSASDWSQVNATVIDTLIKNEVVEDGDLVVLTKGMYKDKSGGTNMMKILRVGDDNY